MPLMGEQAGARLAEPLRLLVKPPAWCLSLNWCLHSRWAQLHIPCRGFVAASAVFHQGATASARVLHPCFMAAIVAHLEHEHGSPCAASLWNCLITGPELPSPNSSLDA